MKSAALIIALVAVLAFIAWRVFRTPRNVAAPPPIYTIEQLYEGTRAIYTSGLTPTNVLGTGSMRPDIPAHPLGDKIVVAVAGLEATPFQQLQEGHYVSYRNSAGVQILHRLGEKSERGFVAYGTANDRSDRDLVTPENYHARVAVVYRLP